MTSAEAPTQLSRFDRAFIYPAKSVYAHLAMTAWLLLAMPVAQAFGLFMLADYLEEDNGALHRFMLESNYVLPGVEVFRVLAVFGTLTSLQLFAACVLALPRLRRGVQPGAGALAFALVLFAGFEVILTIALQGSVQMMVAQLSAAALALLGVRYVAMIAPRSR